MTQPYQQVWLADNGVVKGPILATPNPDKPNTFHILEPGFRLYEHDGYALHPQKADAGIEANQQLDQQQRQIDEKRQALNGL